ncbi:MAG: hypothetical protein QOE84_2224, partial [Actinomycetota bacterium]|nr:hypothetical protein [Actinomycetota bacterium]
MRWIETQDWPACTNPAAAALTAAVSHSLSASTTSGAFEPSSSRTF